MQIIRGRLAVFAVIQYRETLQINILLCRIA